MAVNSFLKSVRKSTGSSSFKESKYGKVHNWIDTGCLALNRIISGDINKGIPAGRVIILAGENSTGKTLISGQIAANALNKSKFDQIIYFDSEGGGSNEFFENVNCDTDKIEQILIESVEDATIKILNAYTELLKYKEEHPDFKCLFILDSLGALVSNKLITDAAKGKQAGEMGLRAKTVNSMVKSLTVPALKSDCSILILNHVYADPTSMFPSKIKNQGGGEGTQYMATVNIQCARKLEKTESVDDNENEFKGTHLVFFTVKNRLVKPFYRTEMYIDFSKGINKYDGLIDPAIEYGFIKQGGAFYEVPSFSDKKIRRKDLLTRDEIWATFIDEFNERGIKDMQYSRIELDSIEEEIEECIVDKNTEEESTEEID